VGYSMVLFAFQSFWYNIGVCRTDKQTVGLIDGRQHMPR